MPIILITGYLSAISDKKIVDEVAEILAKPFDPRVLRSSVHRLLDAMPVDFRQHAGKRRVDGRDLRVRIGSELGRGAREELRLRSHLRVDFKANDDFPLTLSASDELVRAGGANVE